MVTSRRQAPQLAKRLLRTSSAFPNLSMNGILDLVITIMVYKFPHLSREKILQMLELAPEAQQTRFYQEVLQEGLQKGLQKGERSLILRQLNHRLGTIAPELKAKIENLTIEELENLGEALLDFSKVADL